MSTVGSDAIYSHVVVSFRTSPVLRPTFFNILWFVEMQLAQAILRRTPGSGRTDFHMMNRRGRGWLWTE
ncbi:hypothetical protein I7I53_01466 [Histoplasma capsulatum var. duboisii H88]|uniref:Uncharacterized protein n=1 Tax=Ajellomyces capsulatus (strain H88) TaxID=544711 RepID=A0A8A1LI15_AJEC8|nr:hypothetical protein I7I53_01466 [Histoplasma capsulatum var. duboisii H88]